MNSRKDPLVAFLDNTTKDQRCSVTVTFTVKCPKTDVPLNKLADRFNSILKESFEHFLYYEFVCNEELTAFTFTLVHNCTNPTFLINCLTAEVISAAWHQTLSSFKINFALSKCSPGCVILNNIINPLEIYSDKYLYAIRAHRSLAYKNFEKYRTNLYLSNDKV